MPRFLCHLFVNQVLNFFILLHIRQCLLIFAVCEKQSDMGDIKKTESKAKDKGRKKVKISFRKLSEKEHSAYRVPSYPYLVP